MNANDQVAGTGQQGGNAEAACCGTEQLEVCCAPVEKTLCCGAPAKSSPKGCGCR